MRIVFASVDFSEQSRSSALITGTTLATAEVNGVVTQENDNMDNVRFDVVEEWSGPALVRTEWRWIGKCWRIVGRCSDRWVVMNVAHEPGTFEFEWFRQAVTGLAALEASGI